MMRLKSCPKCNGCILIDQDEYGWYEHCMLCGYLRDVTDLVEAPEQHYEREKAEVGAIRKPTIKVSTFNYQPVFQEGLSQSPPESPGEAHDEFHEREKTELRPIRKQTIKVSTFGYQPLFQEGLLQSFSRTDDIQVISQAKAADEESTLGAVPPDVAIVDVDGSSDSLTSIVHGLKQHLPTVDIIVLTSYPGDNQLCQAIKNQVAAYLSKEINGDQLTETVRRVAHGEYPIYEDLAGRSGLIADILSQFQEPSRKIEEDALADPLTMRELEVLNYVAQGYSNKQIAVKLDISGQTIKSHVTSIMSKLDANSRTRAVVIAAQRSLISIA